MSAITITKTKATTDTITQLVDAYGERYFSVTPEYNQLKKDKDALQKLLSVDSGSDEAFRVDGSHFSVTLSPATKSTEITDMPKVREYLGDDLFMKLAGIKITDLRAYLTPPQLAEVIKESNEGSRKLTVTQL